MTTNCLPIVRGAEAIQSRFAVVLLDCFAALAMTEESGGLPFPLIR
jgi:hypothetical protein